MSTGANEKRDEKQAEILVGAAEIDITPPLGTRMMGDLTGKRRVDGVDDPLMLKAIVFESGGARFACAVFDLCWLYSSVGDKAVALASEATGIASDHILWSLTHTHSGPITGFSKEQFPDSPLHAWRAALPSKFAECVKQADAAKVPARVSRVRTYGNKLGANRRLRYKDGRELNEWVLGRDPDEHQCVGAAGPIDPEVGTLVFADLDGQILAVLWNYALHANAKFGMQFSADYPGVVAARLRERFGEQTISVYIPGTCGDINPVRPYKELGNMLAEAMIPKIESRTPLAGPLPIAACKRTITVPCRDFAMDQKQRVRDSLWGEASQRYFLRAQKELREKGLTKRDAIVQAWHIGENAFVGLPGEVFVDWGIKIKQQSPFPWTFPIELANDVLGYLITEQAWQAGGYEALMAYTGQIAVQGVAMIVDEGLAMLKELHGATVQEPASV